MEIGSSDEGERRTSSASHFLSPLRYPGGKRKLANFIRLLFYENDLLDGCYAEVYAGGASVGLSLLYGEFAQRIYINDIDPAVASFWRATLNHTDELLQRVRDTDVTIEEWHRQKAVQDSTDPGLLDLAFSTFFLNRTNRSGIIKGGVIGGKSQQGQWALDARFNKKDLIRRIEKVGRYSSRIELSQLDGAEFITKQLARLPPRTLVYLDPPYYQKGGDLYEHHYQHRDHAQIASLVADIRQPWLVSYDNTPEIADMYQHYRKLEYSIHYSAQARYRGTEVLILAPQLAVPEVGNPSRLSQSEVEAIASAS